MRYREAHNLYVLWRSIAISDILGAKDCFLTREPEKRAPVRVLLSLLHGNPFADLGTYEVQNNVCCVIHTLRERIIK